MSEMIFGQQLEQNTPACARAPVGLLAELTHRCPLQCPYCSNPVELERANRELTTANSVFFSCTSREESRPPAATSRTSCRPPPKRASTPTSSPPACC